MTELPTKKIDLGGGDYAVVYLDVLRITGRLHEALLRRHMKPLGKPVLLSELTPGVNPFTDFEIDIQSYNPDDANEIYILHQVVSWTFGEVNKEVLDTKLTKDKYKLLVEEMDGLYNKPGPFPGRPKGT